MDPGWDIRVNGEFHQVEFCQPHFSLAPRRVDEIYRSGCYPFAAARRNQFYSYSPHGHLQETTIRHYVLVQYLILLHVIDRSILLFNFIIISLQAINICHLIKVITGIFLDKVILNHLKYKNDSWDSRLCFVVAELVLFCIRGREQVINEQASLFKF